MNDFLAVDGGNDTGFLDAAYAAEVGGDTLRLTTSAGGTALGKAIVAGTRLLAGFRRGSGPG